MGRSIREKLLRLLNRPLGAVISLLTTGAAGFLAALVTIREWLGAPGVLATLAGVTAGGLIWYWARLQRQLDSIREQLAGAVAQLGARTDDTRQAHERSEAQLAKVREEHARTESQLEEACQNLHREHDRYESTLAIIVNRGARLVHHRSARVIYEMGTKPNDDRITEEYVTTAGTSSDPIVWYAVRLAAWGQGVPHLDSFRDLVDVDAVERDGEKTYKLDLVAARNVDSAVRGIAIFDREIGIEPRTWSWSCRWPIWNPLREVRRDTVGFEVQPLVEYDDLQVLIILPGTAIRPRMGPTEPANQYLPKLLDRELDDNRAKFLVRLQNPEPGDYVWTVTVDEFEAN
jgi:hypothetical protein